ncbi:hypothetical protein PCANC_06576 [Puccinia coronata f. sp. avenae]|uniref:DUF913 domain-containing protein n=1 Tax=Puccinia coronata f. sp. avenae TaxID=200324 RepID=A0A2N5VA61_9BASI|nr:hypothetical protein PCANC_06576 [Puccinia coronata f. sp. avenae]
MSAQTKILQEHDVLLHYSSDTPAEPRDPLERAGTSKELHQIPSTAAAQQQNPQVHHVSPNKDLAGARRTASLLIRYACRAPGSSGEGRDVQGISPMLVQLTNAGQNPRVLVLTKNYVERSDNELITVLKDASKTGQQYSWSNLMFCQLDQGGVVKDSVTNLDRLLYEFTLAFALFNRIDGLKVFVNRMKEEVDKAHAEHHVDITSSSKPSDLLIGTLILLRRSPQSPLSLDLAPAHLSRNVGELFGHQTYSLAINMMSTSIRSEPTSLAPSAQTNLHNIIRCVVVANPRQDPIKSYIHVLSSASNCFQSATTSISKKEKEKDETDQYSNSLVVILIDIACRLLESMLQNVAHCQDFFTLGAVELLGLLRLPSIPYDFANTQPSVQQSNLNVENGVAYYR